MKKYTCLLSLAALMGGSAASSAVMVDFLIPSESTASGRLNFNTSIAMAFSIDGAGAVTLDASPVAALTNQASIDAINSWDGPVGTVVDSNLFGSSFTLTITAPRKGLDAAITGDGALSGTTNGALGISGGNASRIDGADGAGNPIVRESMVFTLATTNPNLVLTLNSFMAASENASVDASVGAGNGLVEFASIGSGLVTVDTSASAFSIQNGGAFTFANDLQLEKNTGYGLDSFSFTVTAVPEPSTVALFFGVITLGAVCLRRRSKR